MGILPKLHVQVKTIQKIENKEQKVKVLQQKKQINHPKIIQPSSFCQYVSFETTHPPKNVCFFTFFAVYVYIYMGWFLFFGSSGFHHVQGTSLIQRQPVQSQESNGAA